MIPLDVLSADKMFRHPDRLAAGLRGEQPPPVTVELNLTNLCNHACPGCTFSYLVNVSKDRLPFHLAERAIDELAALGVKGLIFSGGGEPLTYGEGEVLTLAKQARARGMEPALITNGSLLRDPRWLDVCAWIRVSLDGYDADTYRRFHGRGERELAKVLANLRALGAYAVARKAAGQPCATLGAGFLADRASLGRGDFARFAELGATIAGLDYVQVRPLVVDMIADPTLTGGGWDTFSAAELADTLAACAAAAARHARPDFQVLASAGKYRALAAPDLGRTVDRCHAHFLQATIAADARVYICCHGQGQEAYCLGDLRAQSFADIWHGERARQVYESISPRDQCPPACRLSQQNAALEELRRPAAHANFI